MTMSTKDISFGSKIKRLRTEKHLSQQKLADLVGINQTFISAIERDEKKPRFDVLTKLANALDVPIGELVDKEERQESFAMMLINQLIDEGFIKDNEVSEKDMEMIIDAIRVDIKRIQKEKGSN